MIPESIVNYLRQHGVAFTRHWHPRVIAAQELAAVLHVSGHRVAKSVIVRVAGKLQIAVLSAADYLDPRRLAAVIGTSRVDFAREEEFAGCFAGCEVGAEPPFGRLFGMPVLVDTSFPRNETIFFRAGSHEEVLEMSFTDFVELEQPAIASFGRPQAFVDEAMAPV